MICVMNWAERSSAAATSGTCTITLLLIDRESDRLGIDRLGDDQAVDDVEADEIRQFPRGLGLVQHERASGCYVIQR